MFIEGKFSVKKKLQQVAMRTRRRVPDPPETADFALTSHYGASTADVCAAARWSAVGLVTAAASPAARAMSTHPITISSIPARRFLPSRFSTGSPLRGLRGAPSPGSPARPLETFSLTGIKASLRCARWGHLAIQQPRTWMLLPSEGLLVKSAQLLA